MAVTGRHRERFLNSQVTSDVQALRPGRSQLSSLLDRSGRLRSMFFLHKGEDAIRLLVPSEAMTATIEGLSEHLIADDVTLVAVDTGPMRLILGPAAAEPSGGSPDGAGMPIQGFGTIGYVQWDGPDPGWPAISDKDVEARRILSGLPAWGVEASSGMLINETSLVDSAVSFHKGCYLGQETVAKVASRRGAAYSPVLLAVESGGDDPSSLVGEAFSVTERTKAGIIRSWARWDNHVYLLVSLWRDFRVDGQRLEIQCAGGERIGGRVVTLPLLPNPSADDVANTLYLRAVELFAADRESEAVDLLERAITVCPNAADAYESLGVILGRHGRFEEAISLMDRLLDVAPDSVMAHTNKSVYFNQLGRIEDAEREAREAAVKGMEKSRREREDAAESRKRHDEEEADRHRREAMFIQVLEIDPSDALANFGLGQLRLESGRFADSVDHLERALSVDPDYSAAYLALGRAFESLGETRRAHDTYSSGVAAAARRGDMKTANSMQERLALMESSESAPSSPDH